ncbi:uncharacterized protein LOC123556462 [Mercenaria mercenaria]|uniref:uncharacterized protein LOC123556462 n=1 Tax=Mercenaria mercenaria TaxID=6596 RepID=UPI00234F179D|nr:uncharacterized protein LOC123556462 [Mercenaria mercenaria]
MLDFKMRTEILCVFIFLHSSTASDVHLYVSPQGSDQNHGDSPATAARTLHKAMRLADKVPDHNSVVYIELMQGYHDLNHTLVVNRDNVVIRAYNDQEVHVTGGQRVPSTLFKTVTDHAILSRLPAKSHAHVRVAHLPNVGITDYGHMGTYGGWRHDPMPIEVFYNGKPLRFAQWPNEGFINIVEVPDGKDGLRFRYKSSVPQTWHNETAPWVYGYWYWSWCDKSVKVKSLDASSQTVTLVEKTNFGLRTGHWNDPAAGYSKQGGYFRFVNVFSALDQPGEYYMDQEHGNLYVWLPNDDGNAKVSDIIYVSMVTHCIQIKRGVRQVTLEGFTLEACRGYGIFGPNVHNIRVTKMEIKNTGAVAVRFNSDSRDCTVSRCLIHDTNGGVFMEGGSRKTLQSSGHTIENNEIFQYSRVGAVGNYAISTYGVGHVIRYNHIYFGQWSAVWYSGNDILMEYNLLHHNCVNASDCGAFHTGRDWTTRGNIIRYNIVHHTLRLVPGADVRGVMLDDQSSSTRITNNVFYNNDVHANIGGGRYNVIANNVMYNATSFSIQVDHRGTKHTNDQDLIRRLHAVPYNSSLWTLRYPELKYLNLQNASIPEGNQIVKNLVFNTQHKQYVHRYNNNFNKPRFFNISETGYSLGRPDHYNIENGDYRVKCYAAEWANSVNFEQVPSPNDVGPRVTVGPTYLHRGLSHLVNLTKSSDVCTTHAPVTDTLVPAYLPDGSRTNDLYNVSKQGCWLSIAGCTDHPNAIGTYRDSWGEQHAHAADNETMCFHRAVSQWNYCGSHKNEQVAAIYGPSGATRLVGDGCYMAMYGCPKHGGPADGHILHTGKIYRDIYAEQHQNATHDEEKCLSRAIAQWTYCGSPRNHPVTSIYRPTGAVRTAGAGCWIHVQHCPKVPDTKPMFYDSWGEANYQTDGLEYACLHQAEYYWTSCGSDFRYPVTAFYRPSTVSKSFP